MHVILDDSTQIRATLTRGEPEASRRDERIPGWGMISGIIFLDSSCGDLRNIRAGNLSLATFWFCDKLVRLLIGRPDHDIDPVIHSRSQTTQYVTVSTFTPYG